MAKSKTQETSTSSAIQEIITAWETGSIELAVRLTNNFTVVEELHFCKGINARGMICNRKLAPQAKGDYCKDHKHQDPLQKERVRLAKQQKRQQEKEAQLS